MRKMVWSVMSVVALALAGCGSSSPQTEGGAASASSTAGAASASSVGGTIAVRGTVQPSPHAQLVISLADVSASQSGSAPVASKTLPAGVTFPYTFDLSFDSAKINQADLYVVQVNLTDGNRHYTMTMPAPVLTKGNKNQATIEMMAEQTPAEKDLAEFNGLIKQIGGMKVSSGTKLDPNASRGWQVFRQAGQVKVIRELVDYGDKGFTSTDFAYKDGQPWVAVQQKKADKDAKPSSIDRVSWTENGIVVLNQEQVGDKTTELSADDASSLHQQAKTILNLATGGKGK